MYCRISEGEEKGTAEGTRTSIVQVMEPQKTREISCQSPTSRLPSLEHRYTALHVLHDISLEGLDCTPKIVETAPQIPSPLWIMKT